MSSNGEDFGQDERDLLMDCTHQAEEIIRSFPLCNLPFNSLVFTNCSGEKIKFTRGKDSIRILITDSNGQEKVKFITSTKNKLPIVAIGDEDVLSKNLEALQSYFSRDNRITDYTGLLPLDFIPSIEVENCEEIETDETIIIAAHYAYMIALHIGKRDGYCMRIPGTYQTVVLQKINERFELKLQTSDKVTLAKIAFSLKDNIICSLNGEGDINALYEILDDALVLRIYLGVSLGRDEINRN